jgi:hypothetical protein
MRPAIAHCRLGLGELEAQGKRGEAGRKHLEEAAALFREMGMASLQARVEETLRGPSR